MKNFSIQGVVVYTSIIQINNPKRNRCIAYFVSPIFWHSFLLGYDTSPAISAWHTQNALHPNRVREYNVFEVGIIRKRYGGRNVEWNYPLFSGHYKDIKSLLLLIRKKATSFGLVLVFYSIYPVRSGQISSLSSLHKCRDARRDLLRLYFHRFESGKTRMDAHLHSCTW